MSCFKDVYFWRQSLILIGDSVHSAGTGLMLSFSSVLNPALLSNSTDIRATPEEVSWISASLGFAGLVGLLVLPPFFQHFGRKTIHIALNCLLSIGFLCFFFSNSITGLFIGKFIQGIDMGGVTITIFIIAEYSHPKRRGYFMTIKKASVSVGSLLCHSLYFSWTWRQIALIAVVPYTISTVMILFWPESPAYLAMKGKYKECEKSHIWLFGNSQKSIKDLDELLTAQMERRNKRPKTPMEMVKRILGKFARKDFMKPTLIVALLTLMVDASGRYYMILYIIQIVVEITGDTSTAVYCSIAADIFTMIALIFQGFVIKRISRRKILLYFGVTSTVLTYILSLIIYLQSNHKIGADLLWLTPSLIVFNSFMGFVGVIPTAFTVIGEIYPLEHKGTGSFAAGVLFTGLYAITVKFIPTIIDELGVEGMFAIFATCLLVCVIGLYFTLIETKDRTLQDIEDEIKGVKRMNECLISAT
ncbi:facilitated trehalose transporter Tret1-like [Pieris napi]|uniref:facilitated trehalose transporter Tret1-like n=1 Tax=Pieris napi TaxID=78633 RepID=UPI001FB900E9|nr:facilitated trehalose transporter Tret1-like [Pieris napi]